MLRFTRRSSLRVVGVLVALLVLAAACSSGGTESGERPAGTIDGGEVNRDGTLKLGYSLTQNGNFSMDPTVGSSGSSMDPLWYLLYGRLLRKLPDGTLVPDLAESAEIVDANTIEVKVRPGQTWHDGAPFDGASVKEGLERNLASENAGNFSAGFFTVESVELVDPLTVRINLPNGDAASWYDSFLSGVQSAFARPDANTGTPIGAGPMKVASYSKDQSLVLERFEDYWNADEVNFARIEMVSIEQNSPHAALAALQSGQADVVTLQTEQLASLSGNFEPVVVSDPNRMLKMTFCKRDEPLSSPEVRKAVSKAIDRDAINEAIFAGTGEPATQLWPEGDRFYNTEVGDELGYDPEGARRLLEEAGETNPTFDVYLLNSFSIPDVAAVVKEQLEEVGITANLKLTANFVAEFLEPKVPGAAFIPPTPNPGAVRLQTLVGGALGNLCGFRDERLERLAAELSQVSSQSDEAKDIWWQIEEIVADEALMAPLLFSSLLGGYDSSNIVLDGLYAEGVWVVPDIYTSYVK